MNATTLRDLGFTETESLVYECLLKDYPVTGYRISQRIAKPTPNTYKALAALAKKGAILVDEGQNRLCRPVPPKELFARLSREYAARCAAAATNLESLNADPLDDRVYRIESVEQVLERARAMLQRAQSIVIADVMPQPLAELRVDMDAAVERGVRVAVLAYEPLEAVHFEWIVSSTEEHQLDQWPGQQLSVCVDAEEHLVSLLSHGMDKVHQAVWSNSTFLSCMQHNNLAAELRLSEQQLRNQHREVEVDFKDASLLRAVPPGLATLQLRYGTKHTESTTSITQ